MNSIEAIQNIYEIFMGNKTNVNGNEELFLLRTVEGTDEKRKRSTEKGGRAYEAARRWGKTIF